MSAPSMITGVFASKQKMQAQKLDVNYETILRITITHAD